MSNEKKIVCPSCQREVPAANFCMLCRASLKTVAKPVVERGSWRSEPGEFAARIRIDDLDTYFKDILLRKQLVVDPGTEAVIVEDGRNVGVVEPGTYTMDSFLARINRFGAKKRISAVVYKGGDLELSFRIDGCPTQDGLSVSVETSLTVRIENAALFASRLMGHVDVFTVTELQDVVRRSVELSVKGCSIQCSADELRYDVNLQKTFDHALESALNELLTSRGIVFGHLRVFNFTHAGYDQLQQDKGEFSLELARFEKITKARRALGNLDKMSQQETQAELERFETTMEQEKWLRESDRIALDLALHEKNTTATKKVEQVLALLETAHAEELAAVRHRLEVAKFDQEAELAKKADAEAARKLEAEIHRDRLAAENRRRGIVDDARTAAEVGDIHREGQRKDAEAAHESAKKEQDLKMARFQAIADIQNQRSQSRHDREMDLRKQETDARLQLIASQSGLSPEQILAMQASENPQVAEAFKSIFNARNTEASAAEVRALYDRMLARGDDQHQQTLQLMKDMFTTAVEKTAAIGMAQAQGIAAASGAVGVPPAAGAVGATPSSRRCTKCSTDNKVDSIFCTNCGTRLIG